MAKNFENHTGHESRAAALGQAVFLRDGLLEAVDCYTPLDEVLAAEGPDPDSPDAALDHLMTITHREFALACQKARLAGVLAMLRFVWFGSNNLWEAMKRLLAITRKTKAEFIRGMSATQVAWMLAETKAATSAREIRVVEGYLISWGVLGFHGTGGGKSLEAREKYSKVQKGNTNRSGRERVKLESPSNKEEDSFDKTPFRARTDLTKADVRRMRDQAERERIARDLGVDPNEIDLSKISPDENENCNSQHHERDFND